MKTYKIFAAYKDYPTDPDDYIFVKANSIQEALVAGDKELAMDWYITGAIESGIES